MGTFSSQQPAQPSQAASRAGSGREGAQGARHPHQAADSRRAAGGGGVACCLATPAGVGEWPEGEQADCPAGKGRTCCGVQRI